MYIRYKEHSHKRDIDAQPDLIASEQRGEGLHLLEAPLQVLLLSHSFSEVRQPWVPRLEITYDTFK